ncbi:MAG TPA: hypothetical protein VHC49_07135 [Mycobacteriales bacterium]|nr:hypothetical protein [Mycobacteriales bacterium]
MTWLALLLGFVGALIGAVAGALITGYYTKYETRQRERAARREEWWRRFEWAASLALSDREIPQTAGLHVLTQLGQSALADTDDAELLQTFSQAVLDVLLSEASPTPEDHFVVRLDPGGDG